jgi:two-component system CheB/CheR fusion protein
MQTRQARMTGDRIREILLNLPIGLVMVDRHYDIQSINRAARRLLGIHGSAIGDDIVHLTQTLPSLTLRAAIDRAFRDEMPASIEDVAMTDAALGEVHYLHIICYPFPRGPEERIDAVILLVADVTATVQVRQALAQEASGLQEENDHLAARVQELTAANHELAEANQNLAAANLDLRGANDELAIRLEEAQSAMEEVETINEEMQATNEELETVNEELQATIEELNATNEELQARTAEMLSHAAPQEAERRANNEQHTRLEATLEALLSSIEDAALVVDAGGTPVRANAAYHRLIGDSALVPLDEQGQPLPPEATPQQRAARGETFTMEFLLPSQRGAARRRRFEARGRPIRVGDTVHGSLVVLRARGAK